MMTMMMQPLFLAGLVGHAYADDATANSRPSRIHPLRGLDDPRLRNPWLGASAEDVASFQAERRALKGAEAGNKGHLRRLQGAKKGWDWGTPPPAPGPVTSSPTPGTGAIVYDAIIVGAGPGGCSAAYTLVAEGVDPTKILMLER